MRGWQGTVGGFHGILRQERTNVAGSRGIAQARGGNGVLPFAQRRSSNPARTQMVLVMPGQKRTSSRCAGHPVFSVGTKTWIAGIKPGNDELEQETVHGDP